VARHVCGLVYHDAGGLDRRLFARRLCERCPLRRSSAFTRATSSLTRTVWRGSRRHRARAPRPCRARCRAPTGTAPACRPERAAGGTPRSHRFGQHDVENDEVEWRLSGQVERRVTVACHGDVVALLPEVVRYELQYGLLVIDDEDAAGTIVIVDLQRSWSTAMIASVSSGVTCAVAGPSGSRRGRARGVGDDTRRRHRQHADRPRLVLDGRLDGSWRISTDATLTADEIRVKLGGLLALQGSSWGDVERLVIASVVPVLTVAYEQLALDATSVPPLVVGPASRRGCVSHTTTRTKWGPIGSPMLSRPSMRTGHPCSSWTSARPRHSTSWMHRVPTLGRHRSGCGDERGGAVPARGPALCGGTRGTGEGHRAHHAGIRAGRTCARRGPHGRRARTAAWTELGSECPVVATGGLAERMARCARR